MGINDKNRALLYPVSQNPNEGIKKSTRPGCNLVDFWLMQ